MRGYCVRISIKDPKNSFIPRSIFDELPSQTPKPTNRRNATYNPQNKDYRFGPVRIDWLDKSKFTMSAGKAKDSRSGPAVASFIPKDLEGSGTGALNLPDGVVHVYRESSRALNEETASPDNSTRDGTILGVLAVPSWMTPSDFLTFAAPAAEGISHLRIIKDSVPNRSMALIKFPKSEDAAEFAEAYNGKPFNSMEPEICHVVHVLSVKIDSEDAIASQFALGSLQGNSSFYELPTCPVCLERMDSAVTGLITVPCSHTFHCTCLSKWGDSRCPVCRYSQTLLKASSSSTSHHPSSSPSSSTFRPPPNATQNLSSCSVCGSTTNLWICLICGNIGCGRYGRAHAHSHYQLTTHLYALELETQRVWDYAGDGYVHRLIQNRADGKLVELPSASMVSDSREGTGGGPSAADALTAEKVEAIGIEYSYLLTSQLDSQRSYYEEQTKELHCQVGELRILIERLQEDLDASRMAERQAEEERKRSEEARVAEILREKTKAEQRANKMTELARRLEKELREERAVSEGLMQNLGTLKEKAKLVDQEKQEFQDKITELEEQLRDVMFYLEAKEKIEQGEGVAGEAAGGSLEVVSTPSKKKGGKKKK
ncbi:brca1-associated protein [Moniliophthora roreri MCA 2997]|uniref:Brca1-associated protein n=1 Tax=Moniliophthora roreri (strain MCA 2997) TaxID=1381753 RepID=V2XVH9_MONRO|nr:brca1-associated protein [Moniliophthora roreri MCA 2997]KAI3602526.1 brca1-associated protein [Moniliophthora roreri]